MYRNTTLITQTTFQTDHTFRILKSIKTNLKNNSARITKPDKGNPIVTFPFNGVCLSLLNVGGQRFSSVTLNVRLCKSVMVTQNSDGYTKQCWLHKTVMVTQNSDGYTKQ